jgi:hypothetical protein
MPIDVIEVRKLIVRIERLIDEPIDSSEAEDVFRDVLPVLEEIRDAALTAPKEPK